MNLAMGPLRAGNHSIGSCMSYGDKGSFLIDVHGIQYKHALDEESTARKGMMRWFSASVLGLVALSGLAQAQLDLAQKILDEVPDCAIDCVKPIFLDGTCPLDNIKDCVCTDVPLQSKLSSCVQLSCPFAEQVSAVVTEGKICEGYPQETRSNEVRLTAILCTAFVIPVILIRFYHRIVVVKKLGLDDYMTLIAFVAHLTVSGIEIASASMGFGRHYWHVKPSAGTTLLQLFWIVQMLYIIILTFTKLAILFFLARVFETRSFQLTVRVLAAFLLCTCIAFVCVDIFQCTPISAVWDRYLEGNARKCVNMTTASYVLAALSIFSDIALLLLPIPWVWRLQMDLRKRLLVAGLFGIGSFVCVTSMVRMRYLVRFSNTLDSTWDNVDVVIWSMIEGFTALLCGSLPAIWPLVSPYIAPIATWTKKVSSSGGESSKKPHEKSITVATSYRLRSYPKNFTELDGSDHELSLSPHQTATTDQDFFASRGTASDDDEYGVKRMGHNETVIRSMT